MDESASQVLAESAPPAEMTILLSQLIAKNKALQQKLDAGSSKSSTGTEAPKPAPPPPADEDEDEDEDDDADEGDGSKSEEDDSGEEIDEPSSAITPPPKPNRADVPTPAAPKAPTSPFAHANSTSHRAEWMSFGRRLDSADAPTKFPELMSLWSSSKDVPCLQLYLCTRTVHVFNYVHTYHTHTHIYRNSCRSQDKLKAFREWLSKNKNYEQAESHMTFLREKESTGAREWECLTILEMVQRQFSTYGAEHFFCMSMWVPVSCWCFCNFNIRTKIEAAVRKPGNGVPGEDCPDDPESTRYWTKTKMVQQELDRTKQSLQTRTKFQATPELANALFLNQGLGPVSKDAHSSVNKNRDESLALVKDLKASGAGHSICRI